MIKIVKLLLFPFAILYDLITRLRNRMYDSGQKLSFEFDVSVIVVGNLNVGGSGKTPMIEYLIRLLKERFRVATLSRGYKRDTKGYRSAGSSDTAKSIGDEPYQLYRKFAPHVNVTVGEDRVFAIPNILHDFPDTEVVLLDDAFQHRPVKPQLSILVTDFYRPFYNDFLMPYGTLREARVGASRASIIVVTKCPEGITFAQRNEIAASIGRYASGYPVFFSGIRYMPPVSLCKQKDVEKSIILVSGLANADAFEFHCKTKYAIVRHFKFGDHHRYTNDDIRNIQTFTVQQKGPVSIITTEKDMVKITSPEFESLVRDMPWHYLPIEQYFIEDGLKFDERIQQSIKNALATE